MQMEPSDELEFKRLKTRAEKDRGLEFNEEQPPQFRKLFDMWAVLAYYKGDTASMNIVDEFIFRDERAAKEAVKWLRELKGITEDAE